MGFFEKERSLVLSIPAGSRTLREVGRQMHSQRSKKKKKNDADDEEFFDQVKDAASSRPIRLCSKYVCIDTSKYTYYENYTDRWGFGPS